MKILQRFGRTIRSMREERKLTQTQLAKKSGLNRTFISRIEAGKINITLTSIFRLARAFKVELYQIMADMEGEELFTYDQYLLAFKPQDIRVLNEN